MTFWRQTHQVMNEGLRHVLRHPFLTGLRDGTLARDAFSQFLIQDSLYLQEYARTLACVAAKAPRLEYLTVLSDHASGAVAAELELHPRLLELNRPELVGTELTGTGLTGTGLAGADLTDPAAARPTPTTVAYTGYLRSVAANGTFAEGLGAVLPCYWIYAQVGQELQKVGSPDPGYQSWIDAYASDEFAAVVAQVVDIAGEIDADLSPGERTRAVEHARVTTTFEWMFWDSAYRLERWPW